MPSCISCVFYFLFFYFLFFLIMITKNLLVYHIYLLDFLIVILSHTTITNTLMTEMVYYTFVSWFSLFVT